MEQIWYASLNSDWLGEVLMAQGPQGVLAVGVRETEQRFTDRVRRMAGITPVKDQQALTASLSQMRAYLHGDRQELDLPIDWRAVTPFQRAVLEAALGVPSGAVATYGQIAARIGRPRAARAVGQALARNPMPILLPCHRVVGADGSMKGYAGPQGIETKRALLRHEKALIT